MKFDYIEHTICGHFIPALINNDPSGLSDSEFRQFERWCRFTHIPESHFDVIDDEGQFALCEVCDLMGDVYTVRQYFPALVEAEQ